MKPLQWSYSALNAFETCPRRYFLTKVSKQVVEPQTEATLWGNRVHKALEHRVGKGTPLPETLQLYEPMAANIASSRDRGVKITCEQRLALTQSFQPTNWTAPNAWVRAVVDVTLEKNNKAAVLDYKTGKPTPESAQLKLSAAFVFAQRHNIQKVTCSFLWLKNNSSTTETFERADAPGIWQEFLPRVQRMEIALRDNKFPANPSGLCRNYCPCTKCEHNGRYDG